MTHKKKSQAGYILIILAAALAALLQILGKPLVEGQTHVSEISPITLAAIVFLVNGLFFTPFSRKKDPLKKIGKKNLVLMAIIGITEASAVITFFFGLKDSNAINASIFSNSEILFSIMIAVLVFREKLQKKEITPFFMIIVGMIILPIGYDIYQNNFTFSELVIGDLLILFSGLLYAVDINICKYIGDRFDPRRITQITSFFSGVFALGILAIFHIPILIQVEQLPAIIGLGILGTGLSTLFFFIALRLIGTVRTVLLYSTTSVFGIIFSAIILGEALTIPDISATVLVFLGIILLRNRISEEDQTNTNQLQRKTVAQNSSSKLTRFVKVKTRRFYSFILRKTMKILLNCVLLFDAG